MQDLPKFLFSEVVDGPRPAEYIIHTNRPRCVGIVERQEGGKVRVWMHQAWEPMSTEEQKKLCLEMKNWFYFKYCHGKIL